MSFLVSRHVVKCNNGDWVIVVHPGLRWEVKFKEIDKPDYTVASGRISDGVCVLEDGRLGRSDMPFDAIAISRVVLAFIQQGVTTEKNRKEDA